jgi:1-acyl-sn-glycerol-3-phosphate acyltransferase
MFERLRRKHPGSSLAKIISWRIAQWCSGMAIRLIYRLHVRNAENVPAEGPVLIAANHQSFLDPPAIGCLVTQRQLDFVARGGLFENRHFGWFIAFLNSIPVAEEGPDAAAIREILRRLGMGRCVMIFPEGSRTPDGTIQPFKRGVALLVKRAKCPVVPAAIEGAFEAWPRERKGPKILGAPKIRVLYGEPIPYDELMKDGADAALARIEREVRALHSKLTTPHVPTPPRSN